MSDFSINEKMTGFLMKDNTTYFFSFINNILVLYDDMNIKIGSLEYLINHNHILTANSSLLYGYLNEPRKIIVFHINEITVSTSKYIDNFNLFNVDTYSYQVFSYVIYETQEILPISKIQFVNDEINYFFNPTTILERQFETNEKGRITKLHKYEILLSKNHSEKFFFRAGAQDISCTLEIHCCEQFPTLNLYSSLNLFFQATKNYEFIFTLYKTIKCFFQFICYRTNIVFKPIGLSGYDSNGKLIRVANLYFASNNEYIPEDIEIVKKTLCYKFIENHISGLIEAIYNAKIPFYNIPKNKKDYQKIGYTRFLSNLSIFEYLYRLTEPPKLKDKDREAKESLLVDLENLKNDSCNSTKKSEINNIIRYIDSTIKNPDKVSLEQKIKNKLEYLSPILNVFIDSKTYDNFDLIAGNITKQRNDFAHCNFDEVYNNIDSIFQVKIIEWINHAMILKYVGFDDSECKKIINIIFNRNQRL